jgi:2-polyprenyl-3-methyl-5-hydroxy-6-metoxy-1,4-benzoquinol methylase
MALKCSSTLQCNPLNQTSYSHDGELEYIRCNDCGLIWRSPGSLHLTKDYDEAYFASKKYAGNREHKIKKSGWLLDMALSLHPGGIQNILEVGCSLGNTLEAAGIRNLKSLGIDISPYAIQYCREHRLNAENKSMDELLAEGLRYDLIFMQHVLEHFEDPFRILSICNKLLNQNGLLLILVPNSRFGKAVRLREKHRFYSQTGVGAEHFVYFSYTSLQKVLESQNFKVLQCNYPFRVKRSWSLEFFLNRIFRRSLSLFNADQELLVIARKMDI